MGTICKRRNKEEERKKRQNERKDLTLTGLLMEGVGTISWWLVGSPVTNIDREVCRFPISAEVIDYSCKTTVKREVLI